MRRMSASLPPVFMRITCGLVATSALGCVHVGARSSAQTSFKIPHEPLKSLSVELVASVGEVEVKGGCEDLLEATISYPEDDFPDVGLKVGGGHGDMRIRGSRSGDRQVGEWDLCLSDDLPTNLHVDVGAGELDLDLRRVDVRSIQLAAGTGETDVVFGVPRTDVRVTIEGGVGEIDLRVPLGASVEIDAKVGIGERTFEGFTRHGEVWRSEAWSKDAPTLHVDLRVGTGEIDVRAYD